MKLPEIRQRLGNFLNHPGFVPLLLLILSILAYGLLIPWQHLYIDDWIWHWTWERMGPTGLFKYFATNRPVWGLLYQATLSTLFPNILGYHIFALVIRWVSSLVSWWLFRLLWPGRSQTALIGAVLFLLYPGFTLQPIALTYSHIFLVYIFFILSLCFNLLAFRNQKRFLSFTVIALFFSLANLIMMEFFFTLEAARFFIIWAVVSRETLGISQRIKQTFIKWIPYFLAFFGAAIWRTFLFTYQNYRYQFNLVSQLDASPLQTIFVLLKQIGIDIAKVGLAAWWPPIERLSLLKVGLTTSVITLLVIGCVSVLIFVVVLSSRNAQKTREKRWALGTMGLGLLTLFAAGWPFWLTGLSIQLLDFKSRFTLPFIIGAVILFLGLIEFIRSHWLKAITLALMLGITSGYHFQISNDFRLDSKSNQQLFWQLAWRAPDIQPGTLVMMNDFPILYYNNATFATELTSIYPTPDDYNNLPYFFLYVRELYFEMGQKLPPNQTIIKDNVTSQFIGSTSQSLMVDFDLIHCVRLLDRNFDAADPSLSDPVQWGAARSDLSLVLVDRPDDQPNMRWFGKEPQHTWCYYFEKAELARQRGDWQTAAQLGDEAARLGYTARDDMEKLVFIEAYAHVGEWDKALEISQTITIASKRHVLCLLWQRIDQQTPPGPEKLRVLQAVTINLPCQ